MNRRSSSLLVLCLGAALGLAAAKARTYGRARHNADYEAGWNACKSD